MNPNEDDTHPRVLTEEEIQDLRDDMENAFQRIKKYRMERKKKTTEDDQEPLFISDDAGFFEPPMMVTPPKTKA